MGVSGSGKTTTGQLLASKLELPFFDADDFHPEENIKKMANNEPLNDSDRMPWLTILAESIKEWGSTTGAVLACSALKESYRQLLSEHTKHIDWVYLSGSYETIKSRMEKRAGHYMKASLLQSQFEALEAPDYAINIDIKNTLAHNVEDIIYQLKMTKKSDIGLIGLGVMGKSLSLNLASNNIKIAVYNRSDGGEAHVVSDFLEAHSDLDTISGFTSIEAFVNALSKPRKIIMMIKAGPTIDKVNTQLLPFLEEGDVVIDGGNSHYQDTIRRTEAFNLKGIHFVGCGISGGEEGARKGPSMMVGGSKTAYELVGPILEKISAKDKNHLACCAHVATDGAGHFVKMVHNGIEYAEMQLLAELYALLSTSYDNEEIASVFEEWNSGPLNSFLLEITVDILRKKDEDGYVLDRILDKAQSKGTGSWSSQVALQLGLPNTMMSSAVFSRYISVLKDSRVSYSEKIDPTSSLVYMYFDTLKAAYGFARTINHQQGFYLLKEASKVYKWQLNLSEIARIWTNGCIIRSKFMEDSIDILKRSNNYFEDDQTFDDLVNSEKYCKQLLTYGLNNRVALDAYCNAYNYWIGMTTRDSSASLIQAQRDYFGAHTYQRNDIDSDEYFHTNW